jgi:hypothetical protein
MWAALLVGAGPAAATPGWGSDSGASASSDSSSAAAKSDPDKPHFNERIRFSNPLSESQLKCRMNVGSDINVKNHHTFESGGLVGTGSILIGRLEEVRPKFV